MPWFSVKAKSGDSETAIVRIYDQIGENWWTGDGTTAKSFTDELDALGDVKNIHVHINSPGGDVADGITIANYLRNHSASVTVYVDGIAASIASVIACAGDQVVMGVGAQMMVHKPWSAAYGMNANDARKIAAELDQFEAAIMEHYVAKAGEEHRNAIQAAVDGETWLLAAQAVEMGLADSTSDKLKHSANACIPGFTRSMAMASANWQQYVGKTSTSGGQGGGQNIPQEILDRSGGQSQVNNQGGSQLSGNQDQQVPAGGQQQGQQDGSVRALEVLRICNAHGVSDLAEQLLVKGSWSIDDIRQYATDIAAARAESITVNSSHGAGNREPENPLIANAKARAEAAANE